jgi:tetratricopeptide (TPR) repeat protein
MRAEARKVAEKLAAAHSTNPAALGVLARLRYAIGEADEAVAHWRRGVSLDPAYAEGHFGIATATLRRGEFAEALQALQRAAELMPNDPRVATALAAAWIGLGRNHEAVAVLEKATENGPLSADAGIILGQAYLEQQEYGKAQRLYEQLVRQTPQEPKAYYGLARCLLALGRREEASRYMQRFQESQELRVEEELRAAHAFSDAQTSRALLVQTLTEAAAFYFQSGDVGQAEQLWRGVAHLEPQNVASRLRLLELYQSQDRSREALGVGEQLCKLEPANAELWFQVAVLHGVLEEFDAALAAANRALELEPENSKYRQARDLILSGRGN